MKLIKLLSLLTVVFTIYSCNKPVEHPHEKKDELLVHIDSLTSVVLTPQNTDSVRAEWFSLYQNKIVKADTTLYARVHYNIARFYGKQENDSAEMYIQRALELIEPTQNNLKDKALIYSGMGNVCNQKSLEHQANYYYNKAAMILLADSTINLKPRAKAMMLLAAAQSNNALYQKELAMTMNKAALALADKLPLGDVNRERPYIQLATLFLQSKNADSAKYYIDGMENLYNNISEMKHPAFLYELKAKYYYLQKEYKSAVKYLLLRKEIDEELYKNVTTETAYINNYYVTLINVVINYTKLTQIDSASFYLKKVDDLQQKYSNQIHTEHRILYYEALSGIFEFTGLNKQAYTAMNKAFDLQKEFCKRKTHKQ